MNIKRAFQKTISEIREDWRIERNTPQGEYPKAMMTSQQEERHTATVNCGADHCSFSRELADRVMKDERFQKFLTDAGAKAVKEDVWRGSCHGYQVRISFPG